MIWVLLSFILYKLQMCIRGHGEELCWFQESFGECDVVSPSLVFDPEPRGTSQSLLSTLKQPIWNTDLLVLTRSKYVFQRIFHPQRKNIHLGKN